MKQCSNVEPVLLFKALLLNNGIPRFVKRLFFLLHNLIAWR